MRRELPPSRIYLSTSRCFIIDSGSCVVRIYQPGCLWRAARVWTGSGGLKPRFECPSSVQHLEVWWFFRFSTEFTQTFMTIFLIASIHHLRSVGRDIPHRRHTYPASPVFSYIWTHCNRMRINRSIITPFYEKKLTLIQCQLLPYNITIVLRLLSSIALSPIVTGKFYPSCR